MRLRQRHLRQTPQTHGAPFLFRQSQELRPGIDPLQPPSPQIEHSISQVGSVPQTVLCHQDGFSRCFQPPQNVPQLTDAFSVQIGGGLIQHKHLRPHGPRAGTGDALLLPAGQSKDIPIQERAHAADLNGGIQDPGHFLPRGPPALQTKEHLAGGVQIEELRLGVLKHGAHGLRQLPQGRSGHIPAAHCDGAFQSSASAMLEQPVDELDDRGFAAPALAGEKDQFSRSHGKRAVPKAGHRLPLIGVRHMVEGDHGSTPLQQIPPKHRARNSRTTVTS